MTKRDKIVKYLAENGIDISRTPYMEERRKWQKSGTIVLNANILTHDEWAKLDNIRMDYTAPVEVHTIREHFEWQYGYNRIIWRGERRE